MSDQNWKYSLSLRGAQQQRASETERTPRRAAGPVGWLGAGYGRAAHERKKSFASTPFLRSSISFSRWKAATPPAALPISVSPPISAARAARCPMSPPRVCNHRAVYQRHAPASCAAVRIGCVYLRGRCGGRRRRRLTASSPAAWAPAARHRRRGSARGSPSLRCVGRWTDVSAAPRPPTAAAALCRSLHVRPLKLGSREYWRLAPAPVFSGTGLVPGWLVLLQRRRLVLASLRKNQH